MKSFSSDSWGKGGNLSLMGALGIVQSMQWGPGLLEDPPSGVTNGVPPGM